MRLVLLLELMVCAATKCMPTTWPSARYATPLPTGGVPVGTKCAGQGYPLSQPRVRARSLMHPNAMATSGTFGSVHKPRRRWVLRRTRVARNKPERHDDVAHGGMLTWQNVDDMSHAVSNNVGCL